MLTKCVITVIIKALIPGQGSGAYGLHPCSSAWLYAYLPRQDGTSSGGYGRRLEFSCMVKKPNPAARYDPLVRLGYKSPYPELGRRHFGRG